MDNREERHGNSQTWNHASTSGQPSLQPLNASSLKPLSPLRAMPQGTPAQPPQSPRPETTVPQSDNRPQPMQQQGAIAPNRQPGVAPQTQQQGNPTPAVQPYNRQQPPQQQGGAPVPAWQTGANPPVQQQGVRNPAMPPLTRQQPSQQQAMPAQAWQPNTNPQAQQPGAQNPAMPPMNRQQPMQSQGVPAPAWQQNAAPRQGMPTSAAQPYSRQQPPQPQGTPAPVWQPDPRAQASQQGAPVPAWQPGGHPQAPQAAPMPQGGQPPARRVWTQTVSQQNPQAAPRPVNADTTPVAAFVPRSMPEPTLVRREPQPGVAYPAPANGNAPSAIGETTRRRRMQAHFDREPEAVETDTATDSRYLTPAFSQGTQATPAELEAESQSARQTAVYGAEAAATRHSHGMAAAPDAPHAPMAAYSPSQSTAREVPDALDDDSGRYDAVSSTPLAEPMPVPTFGVPNIGGPRKHKKRHGLRNLLIVLIFLGAVAFALYQSGLGARLWQNVFPVATDGGSVPSIFGQSPAGATQAGATIAPATQMIAPELRGVKVDPTSATAPAQITFQIETNASTSAILLLTEGNATLHTTAYGTPQGDGLLWQVVADMETSYTGKVRVFLRDQAGSWSEGLITADVDVK